MSRSEFISAQASEKVVLARVEARKRLVGFSLYSGTTYRKAVTAHVINCFLGTTELTEGTGSGTLTSNQWFYNHETGYLYINIGSNPANSEIITDFVFFYGNRPTTASYDLTNSGHHVQYEGRIKSSPGYSHKIGVEQGLTSIVGSGDLVLENNDGDLDEIFDLYFFDERPVTIYSWNVNLDFSDARIIFRGRITNKGYTSDEVRFKVKDSIFDLNQVLPQEAYTDADGVNSSIRGKYKRWVYGRVDGLKCQSIDQIADGYTLAGTVSGNAAELILSGSGTNFLAACSPNDKITIGTQEFTITAVNSNTQLTVSSAVVYSFTGLPAILVPEIPVVTKNREFLIAGHACTILSKTVTKVLQFNRVELSDTIGLEAGDFIEFATSERIEIKTVAPGNIVVLRQNMIVLPAISSVVTRQPVQTVYIGSSRVNSDDYSVTNVSGSLSVTLDSDAEFNIAQAVTIGFTGTFTNGSSTVTTTDDIDLREVLSTRDWIRPTNLSYTTFYEILSVSEQSLTLRTAFSDPTHTGTVLGKRPDYVGDDTIVSVNVLGKTSTGLADNNWIRTGADVVRDVLRELEVPSDFINSASFVEGSNLSTHTISIALPLSPTGGQVRAKDVVDKVSESIKSSLTLDNDLKLKFKVMLPRIQTGITEISDFDVIEWKVSGTSNDIINRIVVRYRHKDIDRFTQSSGSNSISFESSFVNKYIGTQKSDEIDVYLYDQTAAQILAERSVYYRSLGRSDFDITTDLRLEDVEIGDQLILNFARLYKRHGDSSSRKKVVMVIGKKHTGEKTQLNCTDISNLYNRSAFITANTAPDYATSDEDEKLKHGFITDSQGIIDNDDNTSNINLIV